MDYPDYEFHCILAASRKCLKLPNHQLHTVAACGYDLESHHHALADAEACSVIAEARIQRKPSTIFHEKIQISCRKTCIQGGSPIIQRIQKGRFYQYSWDG